MNIEALINEAVKKIAAGKPVPEGKSIPSASLERPRLPEHGDLSSSIALLLASYLGRNPLSIAEEIANEVRANVSGVEKVEVSPPGFINFFYNSETLAGFLTEVLDRDEQYGRSQVGKGTKIQVEFVSANPVGPLNVVNGRAAAVGDALARLLDAAGFDVQKEYYVNDAGTQVGILGRSLAARWSELSGEQGYPFPEEGYKGEYLVELAKKLDSEESLEWLKRLRAGRGQEKIALIDAALNEFKDYALARMLESQKKQLDEYGVKFDVWFRESSLHVDGALAKTLEELRARGFVIEKDGALWFKSGDAEEDKERVLVRSSGEPTYFLGDLAYHWNKHSRGFEKVIDIWGPDHHGHIPRMLSGVSALSVPDGWLEVMIIQMVRLVSDGKIVKMSKRAGEFITLDDLVADVGKDAARYFFLMRRTSSHLDFDIDLARRTTSENPVYYVQYAHARGRNIVALAREKGVYPEMSSVNLSALGNEDESRVMKLLAVFPDVVAGSAIHREPNRMTAYLQELCQGFHQFYHRNRVLGEEKGIQDARLALVEAVSIVLRNGLALLGVSAPERM